MSFDLIALALLFTGWAICGFLAWLAFSVATRGNAGLGNLPLAIFAAVVLGPLVPILGWDGITGLWASIVAALVGPALLIAARRWAFPRREQAPAREPDVSTRDRMAIEATKHDP